MALEMAGHRLHTQECTYHTHTKEARMTSETRGSAIVLGCGPAGLLAALRLSQDGYDVTIMSKRRKSEMFGAQYLHMPVLAIDTPGVEIAYLLGGSIEGYRQKVYGEQWSGVVSPDEFGDEEDHKGWDIRETYNVLWSLMFDKIQDVEFKYGQHIVDLQEDLKPDVLVSTLPAPLLCLRRDEHVFRGQKVYAIGDAPERGIFSPIRSASPNTVLCNGEPDVSWYRTANIFGYVTTEWPEQRKPPYDGVTEITKPLSTTCDCQPNVIRSGRFGRWQKGVLSHESYYSLEVPSEA